MKLDDSILKECFSIPLPYLLLWLAFRANAIDYYNSIGACGGVGYSLDTLHFTPPNLIHVTLDRVAIIFLKRV